MDDLDCGMVCFPSNTCLGGGFWGPEVWQQLGIKNLRKICHDGFLRLSMFCFGPLSLLSFHSAVGATREPDGERPMGLLPFLVRPRGKMRRDVVTGLWEWREHWTPLYLECVP